MKVRLTLDVDAQARYVIARYYRTPSEKRVRATRAQVKRFVQAALRSAVREWADDFPDARSRAVARRLGTPTNDAAGAEFLAEPREKQRALCW